MKTVVVIGISSLVLLLSACGSANNFTQKKFLTLNKIDNITEEKPIKAAPKIIENADNNCLDKNQELSKTLIFENLTTPTALSQLPDLKNQEVALETTNALNLVGDETPPRNATEYLWLSSADRADTEKAIAQGSENTNADQPQATFTARMPRYYKVLIALAIIILLPLFVIGVVYTFLIFLQ